MCKYQDIKQANTVNVDLRRKHQKVYTIVTAWLNSTNENFWYVALKATIGVLDVVSSSRKICIRNCSQLLVIYS